METLAEGATKIRMTDQVAGNIERLRSLFPELVTEGPDGAAVNVDVLRALVSDSTVTDCEEKYGLHWHGKRRARQLALMPSTGTLCPCPEESLDWDSTGNLMIEGDNLEVLKLLQKSYAGKIKLIYIDPPYNTGKDFVYSDNFQDNIKNYLELTGQVAGGAKISSNTESSGRFHTDWLSMIYPRLKLARGLLKGNGVMFVSIDDNEEASLRLLMDEVFGEENRLGTLVWHLGTGPTAGHFLRSHETVLCYARDKALVPNFVWRGGGEVTASALKRISAANPAGDICFPAGIEIEGGGDRVFPREMGGTITQTIVDGVMEFRDGKLCAPVTIRAGWAMKTQIESWLSGKETYDTQGQRVSRIYFSRTGMLMYQKERSVLRPRTVLSDIASTADGSADIERIGLPRTLFSFPKPVSLIGTMIEWITDPAANDTVMDFFAGSGTTGHATFERNAADDGNRKFILVQIPEPILDTACQVEARAIGISDGRLNIAELTKARLRRAALKLKGESAAVSADLGFRVFKLNSSNMRVWESAPANLDQTLFDSVDHLKSDRTEADVLYELLLKLGLDLCVPIEQRTIVGKAVHSIGGGVLIACLATGIAGEEVEPLAQGVVAWHQLLAPGGDTICVFRDSAFADDVAKTNIAAILNQHGLETVRSL
jgi:adenine-specific DNA-methyltransferase